MFSLDVLTNDAKFLLTKMYAEYVNKRKQGKTKSEATNFGTLFEVHQKIMPDWKTDDVKFTVSELKDYGLVAATAASGTYYRIMLRPQAIALLESQFKDKVESVLDYAIKIKSLIPFV